MTQITVGEHKKYSPRQTLSEFLFYQIGISTSKYVCIFDEINSDLNLSAIKPWVPLTVIPLTDQNEIDSFSLSPSPAFSHVSGYIYTHIFTCTHKSVRTLCQRDGKISKSKGLTLAFQISEEIKCLLNSVYWNQFPCFPTILAFKTSSLVILGAQTLYIIILKDILF